MTSRPCNFSPDDQVEFAYGEMESDRAEEFLSHLETCPACKTAVAGLKKAELLCRTVRQAPIPEAKWTETFEPGRAPVPLWKRPLLWAPALAAACALVMWIILRPAPAPEPVAPIPAPAPTPAPVERTHLSVKVAEARGDLKVLRDKDAATERLGQDTLFYAADSLLAEKDSHAILVLDDGSRILAGQNTVLRFDAVGSQGDQLTLAHGQAAFQVTSRSETRPFSVTAEGSHVRVVGTVFAVSLKDKKLLLVGVREGEVQVKPEEEKSPAIDLRANRQVALAPGSTPRPKKLGPELRRLMNRLSPEKPPTKANELARLEPVMPEEKKPEPAAEAPNLAVEEKKPGEKKARVDSVEALVESLYKDTRWIFDDLRSQMDQGNWETALNRLDNYLADPESPNRDDALMLKAACLEKLGRFKEAHQIYRHYLLNWPAGPRATEARHGMLRTRRYR